MTNQIGFTGRCLSFLELFSTYDAVEIPLIQRDYAQGRASEGGIRDLFLVALLEALKTEVPISLDFVYGRVDGKIFQPIDGQQRLTTLFLLHWFLAHKGGRGEVFRSKLKKNSESRFRYSVRPSSGRFFSRLLEYEPSDIDFLLSTQIKKQNWFFMNWLHDPTVESALTMLDAIQLKCTKFDQSVEFYGRMQCITMEVLNLGDRISADDIYLKMNARGMELTGFEKFKAWLIGSHKNLIWSSKNDHQHSWKLLLDGRWLDLFWFFQGKENDPAKRTSEVNFRTISAMAVNFHATTGEVSAEWLKTNAYKQESLWADLFTDECLKRIFTQLDWYSTRTSGEERWPIETLRQRLDDGGVTPFTKEALGSVFFEGTDKEATFEMRLWLHSIDLFIRHKIPQGGHDEIQWFRVVRNLLANTEVGVDSFTNAVLSLDKLGRLVAEAQGSVIVALSNPDFNNDWKPKQLNDQLAEERAKAQLIGRPDTGPWWESLIKTVEGHSVLRGQIELLMPECADLEIFKKRWSVFRKLLDESGACIDRDKHLLVRAIVAQSESIILNSQKRIEFPRSEPEWARELGRNHGNFAFRKGLVELVDSLLADEDATLQMAIRAAQGGASWTSDIVSYGAELFVRSDTKKVQNYYNNGVFLYQKTNSTEGDILLGPVAAFRNKVIQQLLESFGWTFKSGPEKWRYVPVTSDPDVMFFKGHKIGLIKAYDDGKAFCRFDYKRFIIGDVMDTESSKVEIPYPEDCRLESLRDLIAGQPSEACSPLVKAVLVDLFKACQMITDEDGWQKRYASTESLVTEEDSGDRVIVGAEL